MSSANASDRWTRIAALPMTVVNRPSRFVADTATSIREIAERRYLLGLLVRRELRGKYKDSALGFLWSLIRPLTQLLIYYIVLGEFLSLARSIPSFAIFVFTGLATWTLFTDVVNGGTSSIVGNSGLVKKIYLPREVFPLSSVGGALFNFAIQLGILLVATAVVGQFPWSQNAPIALLGIVLVLVWATALGLLLAALNVYLRDIQHLTEVVLTVLFWSSPIVYSFAFVRDALGGGWLLEAYLANPVTLGVLAMQKGLWIAGAAQDGVQNWPADLELRLLVALGISVILLWLAQRVFSKLQSDFAQEL